MLEPVRLLIVALLAIAPLRVDASQSCDVTAHIMEIDMLLGIEGSHQASLRHRIGVLAEDPALIAGSLATRRDWLTLPGHERASLVATVQTWRDWHEAVQHGSRVEPVPAARLSTALRRRMQQIMVLCDAMPDRGRDDGGGSAVLAGSPTADGYQAQRSGSRPPQSKASGIVGTDPVHGGNGLGLLGLLFGVSVAAITLICRMDERQDRRHRFRKTARIAFADDMVREARFRDISRTGCCLELSPTAVPEPPTRCWVLLGPLQIEGTVVWSDNGRIGIAFRRSLSRSDIGAILEGRRPARSGSVSSPFGHAGAFPGKREATRTAKVGI